MEDHMTVHHLLAGCVALDPVGDMMEAMTAVLTGDYLSLLLNLFFSPVRKLSITIAHHFRRTNMDYGTVIFKSVHGTGRN